jgi:prostaglandin-endoperoxide synthase 2
MSGLRSFIIRIAAGLAGKSGWLSEVLNKFAINGLVNAGRNRPHPWSTRSDYISWSSLTDRTYSARMLPEALNPQPLPPVEDVVSLFVPEASGQRPCPKSTALFGAFAQYLTDGFIRTLLSNNDAEEDRKRTTTNHEIDQSPLYGRTISQTRALRLGSEKPGLRGRLKSQMIDGEEFSPFLYLPDGKTLHPDFVGSDGRPILDAPLGETKPWAVKTTLFAAGGDRVNASPQVAMVNTLFLREHNRLAAMLEDRHPHWDDDRVFETARNIIIVMFIKLVVEEYINHISQEPLHLRALPNVAWTAKWNRPNWITAEFSLLYRWHTLVSETMVWAGQAVSGIDASLNNGVLLKGGLANAFADVSANGATQIGLQNSASFIIFAEEKAIGQARTNKLATYNDYRAAMGKSRATSFADVVGRSHDAGDQARRDALGRRLQALYGSVDKLEFYVGLFAEPTQKNGVLPDLLQAMVAMDAFSQALTNPLLSEHVWGNEANQRLTFTDEGLAEIEATSTLRDIVARNSVGLGDRFVGMTRQDWRRS